MSAEGQKQRFKPTPVNGIVDPSTPSGMRPGLSGPPGTRVQSVEEAAALAMLEGLRALGSTSPNPPVGAVVIDDAGVVVGSGHTQPAGQEHAEVMALRAAGHRAQGATVVVTLEPCNHEGKTGPCTQALVDAGVSRVRFIHKDPNPTAAGGADFLRSAGIDVVQVPASQRFKDALLPWLSSIQTGRPHVTLKFAQTLDGHTAALDGSSQWITGAQARKAVLADRAQRDAIIIGTQTALADNPSLTARREDGSLLAQQPRRVVIGRSTLSAEACSNLHSLGFEQYPSIESALQHLWDTGARNVLVEGGATLAASFMEKGLVDAVQAYVAPVLLGQGKGIIESALADSLSAAPRFELQNVEVLGNDVLIEMVPERTGEV